MFWSSASIELFFLDFLVVKTRPFHMEGYHATLKPRFVVKWVRIRFFLQKMRRLGIIDVRNRADISIELDDLDISAALDNAHILFGYCQIDLLARPFFLLHLKDILFLSFGILVQYE